MLFWGGIFVENDTIKVIVEDSFAVEPDSYVVQLNFSSGMEMYLPAGRKTIGKEEALEQIKKIENITQMDASDSNLPAKAKELLEELDDLANSYSLEEEEEEFDFDLVFLKVNGITAFRKLTQIAKENNLIYMPIERTLDKLLDYEKEIQERLINLSKAKAITIAAKENKKIIELIEFKEVNRFGKIVEEEKEEITNENVIEPSGFSILKEKFLEDNYNGYLINQEGLIVIHKKAEITWRME